MVAATFVAIETNVYVFICADCFYQIVFGTAALASHSTKMDGGDRKQSPPSLAWGIWFSFIRSAEVRVGSK